MWETESNQPQETERIAEKLAANLRGGEVIELISDLGGGKTTFVRGLARGLGAPDHVSSPTFKLSNVYSAPKVTLHHFDFYRLNEPGIMANELAEVMTDPAVITVLEWADTVQNILPDERLAITLLYTGADARHITIAYPGSLKYVTEGLL